MDRDTVCALEYLVNIYFDIDFTSSSEDEIVDSVVRHAYRDATNQGAFNTRIKDYQDHYSDSKDDDTVKNMIDEKAEVAVGELKARLEEFDKGGFDFTNWHKDTCEALMKDFKEFTWVDTADKGHAKKNNGIAFTYGNAQKWVNMTIKNIYVLYLVGKLVKDNLGKGYKKFLKDSSAICDKHKDFHLPVDSYIIDAVCHEGLITRDDLINNKFPRVSLPHDPFYKKEKPSENIKGWSQWDYDTYKEFVGRVRARHGEDEDVFAWECEAWIQEKKARNNNQKEKTQKEKE